MNTIFYFQFVSFSLGSPTLSLVERRFNPAHSVCPGEVVLVSMPADSPPEGWRPSLADARHFTSTTSFTQQDVNDGTVWYRHFGSGYESDSFRFQVGDDSFVSCFPTLYFINIKLTPQKLVLSIMNDSNWLQTQ